MTFGNKMRWIAGGLYGLLAVYQLYAVKPLVQGLNLANTYYTWIHAILLAIGAAVMSVWMFHGRENVSSGGKRAIVAGSVFVIIFELMTYTDQTDLLKYAVYSIWPNQVENTTLLYVLMVLRLLLIILAAFFVTSSKNPDKAMLLEAEEADEADEAIEAEDADTVVVVEEEVVIIEDDEETEPEADDKADADEEPKDSEEAGEEKAETDDKKPDGDDEETEKNED